MASYMFKGYKKGLVLMLQFKNALNITSLGNVKMNQMLIMMNVLTSVMTFHVTLTFDLLFSCWTCQGWSLLQISCEIRCFIEYIFNL